MLEKRRDFHPADGAKNILHVLVLALTVFQHVL